MAKPSTDYSNVESKNRDMKYYKSIDDAMSDEPG